MRRFLLSLLICAIASSSMMAQIHVPWDEYCEQPKDAILSSEAICNDWMRCLTSYDETEHRCFFEAYTSLLSECQSIGRDDCIELSSLYTILITAANGPSPDFFDAVLLEYEAGNIDEALNTLLNNPDDFSLPNEDNFLTDLAYGIFYSALDQHEEALAAFTSSIRWRYDYPIAYYLRGNEYLALGNLELASRDFYYYNIYSPQALWDLIPLPQSTFSIPTEMTTWNLYPIHEQIYSTPGVTIIHDLTLQPAINVQMALLDGGETALLTNVPDETHPFVISRPIFLYHSETDSFTMIQIAEISVDFMLEAGSFSYDFAYSPRLGVRYGSKVYILSHDKYWQLYEYTSYSEASSLRSYLLLPYSTSDPRTTLTRPCPGLPASWIYIGDDLQLTDYRLTRIYTELYSNEPLLDSRALREGDHHITVVDGPICGSEDVWWQVSVDGEQFGWIRNDYGLLSDRANAILFESENFPTLDDLIELANN